MWVNCVESVCWELWGCVERMFCEGVLRGCIEKRCQLGFQCWEGVLRWCVLRGYDPFVALLYCCMHLISLLTAALPHYCRTVEGDFPHHSSFITTHSPSSRASRRARRPTAPFNGNPPPAWPASPRGVKQSLGGEVLEGYQRGGDRVYWRGGMLQSVDRVSEW